MERFHAPVEDFWCRVTPETRETFRLLPSGFERCHPLKGVWGAVLQGDGTNDAGFVGMEKARGGEETVDMDEPVIAVAPSDAFEHSDRPDGRLFSRPEQR